MRISKVSLNKEQINRLRANIDAIQHIDTFEFFSGCESAQLKPLHKLDQQANAKIIVPQASFVKS